MSDKEKIYTVTEAQLKDMWLRGRNCGLEESAHMVIQLLPSSELHLASDLAQAFLEAKKHEPYGTPNIEGI